MDDLLIETSKLSHSDIEKLEKSTGAQTEVIEPKSLTGEAVSIVTLIGLAIDALPLVLDFIVRMRTVGHVAVTYRGTRIEISSASRSEIENIIKNLLGSLPKQ